MRWNRFFLYSGCKPDDISFEIANLEERGIDLQAKLSKLNGDIVPMNPVNYLVVKNQTQLHPTFNTLYDQNHGLQILINDTEYTKIYLEPNSYTYNSATKKWSAIIVVKIIDHFGLDQNDADKYQDVPFGDGFAAWYVLQKRFNVIPFLTRVITRCRISGTLI